MVKYVMIIFEFIDMNEWRFKHRLSLRQRFFRRTISQQIKYTFNLPQNSSHWRHHKMLIANKMDFSVYSCLKK